MTTKPAVRKVELSLKNIKLLRDLDACCFPEDARPDYFEGTWFMAYWDKTPVGYGCIDVENNVGHLARIGVLPEARGRGIGQSLIEARMRYALRQGCTVVQTYTHAESVASANNLIKLGFRLYRPDENYYPELLYWQRNLLVAL
jgi:ribosomal protein S18 acetylase RimI-like enzyme